MSGKQFVVDKYKLGHIIKYYRNLLGMTQDELAEKAEILDKRTISNIENGNTNVKLDNIIRISQVLGVNLDELVEGTVKPIENLNREVKFVNKNMFSVSIEVNKKTISMVITKESDGPYNKFDMLLDLILELGKEFTDINTTE